ncbi:MAG: hypothetical protein ACRED1_01460 [Limisphaerales bacterium]
MKPVTYNGETLGEQTRLFSEPRCGLSLLGAGGGGASLSSNPSATSSAANSVGGVTVNNGAQGLQLNSTTLMIAGAIGLALLLLFGMFHGRH